MIEARPDCCEEASFIVPPLPCNRPATRMIGWPERGEGPYRMCDMCAHHNVKNRNATDLGPYEKETPK